MTYNIEEISRAFMEAMKATRDVSVDTDTDSQRRTARQRVLDLWNEDIGRALAAKDALLLDEAHLEGSSATCSMPGSPMPAVASTCAACFRMARSLRA